MQTRMNYRAKPLGEQAQKSTTEVAMSDKRTGKKMKRSAALAPVMSIEGTAPEVSDLTQHTGMKKKSK